MCDFWINIAEELTSKIDFDFARFYEDMAYKGGSLISPDLFKEFMAPYYKKIIDFTKSRGIKHFIVDSDGYVEDLIPLFKSVGMTGLLPFEVMAGNNIEKIRRVHPDFMIFGGVDKTAMSDYKTIDIELAKVKKMIGQGGYIPYIDHGIPPNTSFNNFKYYRNKLNEIIDEVKVRPVKN